MSRPMNQLISSSSFRKWCYNLSGFNQLGLWRDDFLYKGPDIIEALKRVPQQIVDERNFRITRAMQLDAQKRILPKEEWTKFEEDVLYLTPHVEDVKREREERENWEKS